ncbi:hypothetical protein KUTeg_001040 [Tegillarca granosa]|uniref:Uncharacterized protein n=1 Tax=Tegillarca granosa TaxID=220873 RepID=A0ABQ9G0D0_TEGGR|nr:hypothetical protein KUTeg_001040 [Tegillarca granosa]
MFGLMTAVEKFSLEPDHYVNVLAVVGKLVSLKTRCLYQCIVARASWNAQVHVTNEAINEIMNVLEAQCKTIE